MLQKGALILILLCCLSAYTAESEEEDSQGENEHGKLNCGRTNATSTRNTSNVRIIQAREAEKGAWPWMAEIFAIRRNKSFEVCGGALLNRFYVLTAAHCVTRRGTAVDPKDISVRLGDHDLKSDKDGMKPINSNVTLITIHEGYDPATYANDIALLLLGHPVNFSNYIQPICLPEDEDPLLDEERGTLNGYVAGWGVSTNNGDGKDVLTEMSALIVNDEVCQEAYQGRTLITDVNICSVGVNGSSPCQGFGGGPVVLPGKDNRYHIVGIVSFGVGCGNPEFPDVNTRVNKYVDWIKEYAK